MPAFCGPYLQRPAPKRVQNGQEAALEGVAKHLGGRCWSWQGVRWHGAPAAPACADRRQLGTVSCRLPSFALQLLGFLPDLIWLTALLPASLLVPAKLHCQTVTGERL